MGQGGAISTRDKTDGSNDYGVAPSYRWGIGTQTELTGQRPGPAQQRPAGLWRAAAKRPAGESRLRHHLRLFERPHEPGHRRRSAAQVKHKFDARHHPAQPAPVQQRDHRCAIETALQGLGTFAPGTGFTPVHARAGSATCRWTTRSWRGCRATTARSTTPPCSTRSKRAATSPPAPSSTSWLVGGRVRPRRLPQPGLHPHRILQRGPAAAGLHRLRPGA